MGDGSEVLPLLSLARERSRERVGERDREGGKEQSCVPYVEKKHSSTHTSPVSSRDYPSALRSDGGHAGMNR